MMKRRSLNRVGVLGLSVIALAFGLGSSAFGCGDSESKKPGAQADTDASQPGADTGVPGQDGSTTAPPTIDIVVASVTVYAGQKTQLIASQSKASNGDTLSFGWSVTSVPPNSGITTSSIQGTNELVSFVPDVAGDYVITVTATTGTVTEKKDVTVKALNAPVFYLRTTSGKYLEDLGYELRTVQMDGTGDHSVACTQTMFRNIPAKYIGDGGMLSLGEDGGDAGPLAQYFGLMNFTMASMFADQAIDWWEAPAGEPSHAAFQNVSIFDGGPDGATQETQLFIATQDNSCQNPPFAARQFKGKSGDGVYQPKFSPDGRRVAFVELHDDKAMLVTTAIDGTDAREIGPFCEDGTNECYAGKYLFPRRPQWIDETHVGWLRLTTITDTSVGWEIVVAPDLPGAAISRYLTCASGTAPLLFNFLRDGNVLIGASATPKGPENLLVMGRSAGGSCNVVRNLTNLTVNGSYARDFSISPDGTQVAYIHKVGDPNASIDAGNGIRQGGDLYVVPLDGSEAPRPVGDIPRNANFGPRYIAAGTRFAWNGSSPPPANYDAGIALPDGEVPDGAPVEGISKGFFEAGIPSMNVMLTDGGQYTVVAYGDPASGTYVLGGGNGGSCTLECNNLGCDPKCNQQCGQQCDPKTGCSSVSNQPASGPVFVSSLFALALFARRTRRPKRK